MADTYYCEKCKKTMRPDQFYGSNNTEKYPTGKLNQCKKCITMHVDNYNPDTYLWILQECDVPYVPDQWDDILKTYVSENRKITSVSILGRYLSKMKLNQFNKYRWKHTEELQKLKEKEIREAMKNQGYDDTDITSAILQQQAVTPSYSNIQPPVYQEENNPFLASGQEDYFTEMSGADDFDDELTEKERIYLRLKWGKTYKPEEWIKLEQLYEEMMASYDIQGAGHIDTLKLVCKTSLKANQLIDMGDIEGYQKMSKVYNELMKSGKFTAAQNKADNGEFVDSVGELIELCEKQGYIEKFYIDSPNDKVDLTIQDMQRYTKTLIEEETNLTLMVEKALRENEKEDKDNDSLVDLDIVDDIDLTLEDIEKTIKLEDYEEFEEFLENEEAQNENVFAGGGD